MATELHKSPIFGPVKSRRLGLSLGINLMPGDGKICTFDCIYCECGFNKERIPTLPRPAREEIKVALGNKLREMAEDGTLPDVLTFSGNGEPTGHPHFAGIIDDTIELRDKYCPNARVSVLSNATFIGKTDVREALMKVDNNILKLDTVCMEYIKLVDRPLQRHYDIREVIENMKKFNGHIIIQTMFMRGQLNGTDIDNTSEKYVETWLNAIKEICPQQVMIYTIDRDTPAVRLKKAEPKVLDCIKRQVEELGVACSVAY